MNEDCLFVTFRFSPNEGQLTTVSRFILSNLTYIPTLRVSRRFHSRLQLVPYSDRVCLTFLPVVINHLFHMDLSYSPGIISSLKVLYS